MEICHDSNKILLGVVYLPKGDINEFENLHSSLFPKYCNTIILRDFNCNLFCTNKSTRFRSICQRSDLTIIHNSLPTHFDVFNKSSSLLDFCLTSMHNCFEFANQMQCPGISHHSFIFLSFKTMKTDFNESYEYKDYKKIDMLLLLRHLSMQCFDELYRTNDVNLQLQVFNRIMLNLFELVPTTKVKQRHQILPNLKSNELVYQKSLRDLAFKAFCKNRTNANWMLYCKFRNKAKSLTRKLKRKVVDSKFKGLDSKQMWHCLRHVGCLESNKGVVNLDPNEVSDYFQSCQSSEKQQFVVETKYKERANSLHFANITFNELYLAFSKIKSNAIGPDGIPIKFLKILLPYIDSHLLHLINTVLTTSVFPDSWKTARIVPILKKGLSNDFDNLRSISILPALSKIVENILKEQILEHIKRYSLLENAQHGFRNGHSTTTLLLEMTDAIRNNWNANKISVLLSVDLTKAFDRLNHEILLEKLLDRFQFAKSAHSLIKSFLSHRNQFVSIAEKRSTTVNVISGVPQGSVLGPLLFTMYMNDLCSTVTSPRCQAFLYADDIFLLFTGDRHYEDVMEAQMKYTIANMSKWLKSNKLEINISKTKAMGFNLSGCAPINVVFSNAVIPFQSHIKCLGVTIDENLKFEEHINCISQRINFLLRRLYNINVELPLRTKATVAHSLLMPHIIYGLEIYSGTIKKNTGIVKRIMNKILRYVYNFRIQDHSTPYMIKFLGCDFHAFITSRSMTTFYKVMKFQVPQELSDSFRFSRSRRNRQIIIPKIKNTQYEHSFMVRIARCWNSLPSDLKNFRVCPRTFNSQLVQHLSIEVA